jgi:hypothetical protein
VFILVIYGKAKAHCFKNISREKHSSLFFRSDSDNEKSFTALAPFRVTQHEVPLSGDSCFRGNSKRKKYVYNNDLRWIIDIRFHANFSTIL